MITSSEVGWSFIIIIPYASLNRMQEKQASNCNLSSPSVHISMCFPNTISKSTEAFNSLSTDFHKSYTYKSLS